MSHYRRSCNHRGRCLPLLESTPLAEMQLYNDITTIWRMAFSFEFMENRESSFKAMQYSMQRSMTDLQYNKDGICRKDNL